MTRQECEEHISLDPVSQLPIDTGLSVEPKANPLLELAQLAFPYSVSKYRGRQRSICEVLGLRLSSYQSLAKPLGVARLSLPLLLRAAKFCADRARAYEALSVRFAAMAEDRRAKNAPKHRGMLEVRVRDGSGIPRNAKGWRNGNAPGFDKAGGKNLEPF